MPYAKDSTNNATPAAAAMVMGVVEKEKTAEPSDESESKQTTLPLELVIDGKYIDKNLALAGAKKCDIENVLKEKKLKLSELLYCDVRQDGNAYFAPKRDQAFCGTLDISGGANW